MQVADLFRPPLGVLSVKCPSRANQASGLAGGFDYWLSALGYGYDSVINAYGTQSESVHPHLLGKGWDLTVYSNAIILLSVHPAGKDAIAPARWC